MNKLRGLMVLANDPKGHDVCFSSMSQGWMLENEDGFIYVFTSFSKAIAAMAQRVGLNGSGYEWTVRNNPYSKG